MTDEELARLTDSELIELLAAIAAEIEIRMMQLPYETNVGGKTDGDF